MFNFTKTLSTLALSALLVLGLGSAAFAANDPIDMEKTQVDLDRGNYVEDQTVEFTVTGDLTDAETGEAQLKVNVYPSSWSWENASNPQLGYVDSITVDNTPQVGNYSVGFSQDLDDGNYTLRVKDKRKNFKEVDFTDFTVDYAGVEITSPTTSEAKVGVGETLDIEVDSFYEPTFTADSGNVSVSDEGVVTGVAYGEAEVTVENKTGSNESLDITVINYSEVNSIIEALNEDDQIHSLFIDQLKQFKKDVDNQAELDSQLEAMKEDSDIDFDALLADEDTSDEDTDTIPDLDEADVYEVKAGDTMTGIASRIDGTTFNELAELNSSKEDLSALEVGEMIYIPEGAEVQEKTSEEPVDEEPTDEEPVDEEPVDEEPEDEDEGFWTNRWTYIGLFGAVIVALFGSRALIKKRLS